MWWDTDGQSWCHLAPQEQVTAAVAHAVEQQMQKLLEETQLDMNEFDNLLQPIIDTCTKDAISVRAVGRVGSGPLPGERPPEPVGRAAGAVPICSCPSPEPWAPHPRLCPDLPGHLPVLQLGQPSSAHPLL